MFKVISPGTRLIASIGDTSPPNTQFERLVYIGERFEKEGRLPLKAGSTRPLTESHLQQAAERLTPKADLGEGNFEAIQGLVLKGDQGRIKEAVQQMLERGFNAQDILQHGMLCAMEVLGERFKDGSVFIPEVLLSARAIKEALTVLEPHLASFDRESRGTVMIGTVRGDLHDIGKNLVLTMLKGVGFDTIDLGINVKTEDIVRQVAEKRPDILGLSALLTTTMPEMKKVIDALEEAGFRGDLKIIVGGAPVNQKFAERIGADGYAKDAGEAISLVKQLMHSPTE
ncbi:MAG: corrinoid protein [Desulfobacterales bacterium]|nr:corrinoid protein [Desulfobacterales bacterium]MBL7225742.1 corrinoid protein [Desulfobacteraceae bacterium]